MPAGDQTDKPASAKPGSADTHGAGTSAVEGVSLARETYVRFLEVVEHDGRYPLEAYRFLQEGLEFAVARIHGVTATEAPAEGTSRHVDGIQLCLGLRDLAVERWGFLAKTVLNSWGIHSSRDFGQMVFVLVENDFLHKTDRDSLEHFEDVFSFADFEHLYEVPKSPLHRSEFEYADDTPAEQP